MTYMTTLLYLLIFFFIALLGASVLQRLNAERAMSAFIIGVAAVICLGIYVLR